MARGLGKGINALFQTPEVEASEKVELIAISELRPNPFQPRKVFVQQAIEELAASIKEHGILQPIIVRKTAKGYEIVVGERRFRAAKLAELAEVPVVVREMSKRQMMELAVLENLQREDLSAIEEALAYQTLIDQLSLTQEQIATRLGKSRPHITNHLRLLLLPDNVQQLISEGKLSMGHGRALVGLKNKTQLQALVDKTIKESLNVRQLEALIQQLNDNVSRETNKKVEKKNVFIQEQEERLRGYFGTAVSIKQQRKDKGKIEIEYYSNEDLERVLELLSKQ